MPGGGVGSITWLMDNVFVGWILSWVYDSHGAAA